MYRIVSRFLALFYFYLPPRLSFSLLLKRATNTLSLSLSSGEAKSLKKKKRFEREESSKTKRPFFARDFNSRVSPFKSKTKCLRARTFANTLKNTQTTNTFRALDYWYARSVVLIFSALTFCAFAHGCAVYPEEIFSGGRNFRSVDRIFVSVSHVRRAQSSRLDEVPNFLERRSATQSVFLVTIFRNSDIDAHRACGE